jgi:manganese/zinc/iron transport system permease protein
MSFLADRSFWEITAVLAAVASACAILGVFLVVRRIALLSDAIGHVLLLGIVLAFLVVRDLDSPWLMVGAALAGVATVALVEAISRGPVKEDAAIGLVFPALFALGVLLTTLNARNLHLDVDAVMLGMPEFVLYPRLVIGDYDWGPRSFFLMLGMTAANALFVWVVFKELKLSTFDPILAASFGFLPGVLHYALMAFVSATAVTAFDKVGPVLVVAFFVIPPATAFLLTQRLSRMVPLAVAIAILGVFAGQLVARQLDTTTAGTIATVMGTGFAVTLTGRALASRLLASRAP